MEGMPLREILNEIESLASLLHDAVEEETLKTKEKTENE
jgi:hypothetical protein